MAGVPLESGWVEAYASDPDALQTQQLAVAPLSEAQANTLAHLVAQVVLLYNLVYIIECIS